MRPDRAEWSDRLDRLVREVGAPLGHKLLYGPWDTIDRGHVAFISANPGLGPPSEESHALDEPAGNSYRVGRARTLSPLTEQFLAMATFLGADPDDILTGVANPLRSRSLAELTQAQASAGRALATEFWRAALAYRPRTLVIACSALATRVARDATGATLAGSIPAGWGRVRIRLYATGNGARVVQLPHLSRYRLFGRPASEAALASALRT